MVTGVDEILFFSFKNIKRKRKRYECNIKSKKKGFSK